MRYWSIKSGIISLLFVFISSWGNAQHQDINEQIDKYKLSIERKVDSLKGLSFNDKYKDILNIREIIHIYLDLNMDSALVYSKKEVEIALQLENLDELASSRINSSNILNQLGEFELAKIVLLYNLRESDKINDTLLAFTKSCLSNIYINTGEYDKSIKEGLEAADSFEQLKDSSNVGFSYISVAEVYSLALDNAVESIKYIKKAILFLNAKSASKEYLIAALLTFGDISVKQKDNENALKIFLEAEQVAINNNEYWYYPGIMTKLGKVYYYKKEHEKSIFYLEKAVNRIESNGTSQASRYEYLGLNYRDLNQPRKAISYFNLCLKYEQNERVLNFYREYLVTCYLQISDYQSAFNLQKEIIEYKEGINKAKQKEKVTEIIEKYENDKKQQEINSLSIEAVLQENQIKQQQYFF